MELEEQADEGPVGPPRARPRVDGVHEEVPLVRIRPDNHGHLSREARVVLHLTQRLTYSNVPGSCAA